MDPAALHLRLDRIAPSVLAAGDDPDLAEVEAHGRAGCSRCGRALINARETGLEAVLGAAPPVAPAAALRARVLAAAAARRPTGGTEGLGGKPRRFFDASAELARAHIDAPGDAERTAEVDDLDAFEPRDGDACERFLAQIERFTGFSLLFVSVVRGERVGYRAQRGLDVGDGTMKNRRRENTFCTHILSTTTSALGGEADALVVPNAEEEPFFRGSYMVRREGVKTYVGVPLTTSRGVAIGTLCAMDFRPRVIRPEMVRLLTLYTEPVLAEIERARRMPAERLLRSEGGAPLHREAWFRSLLDLEIVLARAASRPTALLVARGPRADALADVARPHEPVGRIGPDAVALLLPGADARGADNRAAEARDALLSLHTGDPARPQAAPRPPLVAVPVADHADGASWIAAAVDAS